MDLNLQSIWESAETFGYETRKNHKDGLEAWTSTKNSYPDNEKIKVSQQIKELIKKYYFAKETDEDHQNVSFADESFDAPLVNTNNGATNELDHFFIQHFRIPTKEGFSLSQRKFAQIAYNAGQFRAEREQNNYPDYVIKFYDSHKIGDYMTYLE